MVGDDSSLSRHCGEEGILDAAYFCSMEAKEMGELLSVEMLILSRVSDRAERIFRSGRFEGWVKGVEIFSI